MCLRSGSASKIACASLFAGDEGQEELLEAGAFGEAEPVELDAHFVGGDGAKDGAEADDGFRVVSEMKADVDGGRRGEKARGTDERAAEADVDRLCFDGFGFGLEVNS